MEKSRELGELVNPEIQEVFEGFGRGCEEEITFEGSREGAQSEREGR